MERLSFMFHRFIPLLLLLTSIACSVQSSNEIINRDEDFYLEKVKIGDKIGLTFNNLSTLDGIKLTFSLPVNSKSIRENILLSDDSGNMIQINFECDGDNEVFISFVNQIRSYTSYSLVINNGLQSLTGKNISIGKVIYISTGNLATSNLPQLSDAELLNKVQQYTFRYFWQGADPNSGMAKERNSVPNIVTTGGTGFGIMAMCVAVERKFVTRVDACKRINKIVSFLKNKATSYHGAFSHWIYGDTGQTKPFSPDDDGADLVETAFLFQGLLTARTFFDGSSPDELLLRETITSLWEAVDWNFFTKEGTEQVLYWHWSPEKQWKMNMPIRGWNEALIVYVLAASSPTHPISNEVYENGWCRNGEMKNGESYYGITLPLGPRLGGPLFFEHYSFMGLDHRMISDKYVNYWEQACAHARINYEYCLVNPKGYIGYGPSCWGLTASDTKNGYTASSPTNDVGTIAPTAALSSFPYTPKESMAALRFFYHQLGDRLWGEFGFIDAFNLSAKWFDSSEHLAIDQGPIVVMIENYRTGLLWNLFMQNKEIVNGLNRLGFQIKTIK